MNGALFFFAVDVANVVCVVLFGARIVIAYPRQRNAQLIAAITVAAICHVVLARYDYGFWIPAAYRIDVGAWEPVLNLARNTAPGLFMILIFRLFTDAPKFPRWLLVLFAVQLFLEEPVRWFLPADGQAWWFATQIAPTVLQTLFVGFAIYWTIDNWRIDLVEARRRTRAAVAVLLGINVVASSLLLRVVIPQNSLANYDTHLVLSVFNLVIIAFLLLQMMSGDIAPYIDPDFVATKRVPEPKNAEDDAALAQLTALIDAKGAYREPGLTLAGLATRVGVPEYRLRRLIHEEMGYRNFNAFLHHYRVREACAQLSDPAMRRVPVLTIALSVGYQSINTFNRGFREVMGMTPSAYRAENPSPNPE